MSRGTGHRDGVAPHGFSRLEHDPERPPVFGKDAQKKPDHDREIMI
jgi:hypothetical protein